MHVDVTEGLKRVYETLLTKLYHVAAWNWICWKEWIKFILKLLSNDKTFKSYTCIQSYFCFMKFE